MRETWVPSLGRVGPLEKGKAPHSSVPAWRIPWTVWPLGWPRAGHDQRFALFTHAECQLAFPVVLVVKKTKNPPANAGAIRDVRLSPELGRAPGEGNGNPLQ